MTDIHDDAAHHGKCDRNVQHNAAAQGPLIN
jgi:hypothetical protein